LIGGIWLGTRQLKKRAAANELDMNHQGEN